MRGYRQNKGIAPLRENIAAAMITLSGWKPDKEILFDPFCGSGTLLIEAAMIALNIAPGGNRHFVSENWSFINKKAWIEERDHCYSDEKLGRAIQIVGSDYDQTAIRSAIKNSERALQDQVISFRNGDFFCQEPPAKYGVMISNPPYGERLGSIEEAIELYEKIGLRLRDQYPDWSYHFITAEQELPTFLKIPSSKNRKLYNGGLKCYFHQFLKLPTHIQHDHYMIIETHGFS